MEQVVVRIGNSLGIVIPREIRKNMGLAKGTKILVEQTPSGEAVVITKPGAKAKLRPVAGREFKRWLRKVMAEDAEILDELAVR